MKILTEFIRAFICMTVHRDQQMIHTAGGKHEIICKTCILSYGRNRKEDSIKNGILTFFYFGPAWLSFPFLIFMAPVSMIHQWLTGWPGRFEYPPEHGPKFPLKRR